MFDTRIRPPRVETVTRSRAGFTLLELMVVVVVAGALFMIGLRPANKQRDKLNARSARVEASQSLALARSAAIARGCRAVFHMNATSSASPNSKMWVTVCRNSDIGRASTTVVDTLGRIDSLSKRFGVTVAGSPDSVQFDARGLSVGFASAGFSFTTGSGARDSLTVNAIGKVTQ